MKNFLVHLWCHFCLTLSVHTVLAGAVVFGSLAYALSLIALVIQGRAEDEIDDLYIDLGGEG